MGKKLATYCRTSTDKQEKGLEAQQRALADWLRLKGVAETDAVAFADEGISGMKSSRPELDAMMKRVRAGEFHTVLVYSFSRFARSTKHLLDTLEEFRELGVNFASHTENIDTSTPIGKAMFTIIAAIAQLERDLTAERVRNGLKNARAKGKRLGAPKRVPDERIRALRAQGRDVRAIVRELKVSQRSVYRALARNPAK